MLASLLMPAVAGAREKKIDPEDSLYTSARLYEEEGMTTSFMTVIRRDEIERMGVATLDELLRAIGVVSVIRLGGHGAPASLAVRGTDPGQSLVMIDGVAVASAADGRLDISGISLYDVERIEIARGPHPVSHGSGAESGVVNIITQKGGGDWDITMAYAMGSHGAEEPRISIRSGQKYRWRLSGAYEQADGVSAMRGKGAEEDGYQVTSYSGYFGMPLGGSGTLELSAGRSQGERELDPLTPGSLRAFDDPDLREERDRTMYMARMIYFSSESVMHTLTAAEWTQEALTLDPTYELYDYGTDTYSTVDHRRQEDTTVRVGSYQADIYDGTNGIGIIGLEARTEELESAISNDAVSGDFSDSLTMLSAFLNLKMVDGPFIFIFGGRHMENEEYGEFDTYRISALQAEGDGLAYRAAYATSLRLPSVGQYHITNGLGLEPEQTTSWELGFTKQSGKDTVYEVTYFDQDVFMPIVVNSGGMPVNGNEMEVNGVEASITHRSSESLSYALSYVWQRAKDKATGESLPLRAEDRVDLRIGYGGRGFAMQVDYTYMGGRYDPAIMKDLAPYNVVHLGARYTLSDTFSLYGRVENVLDEEYFDIGGLQAPLRTWLAGLRAAF